jgi:hypothetical protein
VVDLPASGEQARLALRPSTSHSTLQDRLLLAEAALGWEVREPAGRLRLQLALVLRRSSRNRR